MSLPLNPVVVEFPLRGEWFAPNTPAKRIPSHGTDMLGETYAYDFVMVDWNRKGKPFFRGRTVRHLFLGTPLARCYGWGQGVYAPFDGKVVCASDGLAERRRVHPVSDMLVALRNARRFDIRNPDVHALAGNHIILESDGVYALLAHLKQGSVRVAQGQMVRTGDLLGQVGHSGNSTAPHLHFQLMDSADARTMKGIPCAFKRYEVFKHEQWEAVSDGIPSDRERFRLR